MNRRGFFRAIAAAAGVARNPRAFAKALRAFVEPKPSANQFVSAAAVQRYFAERFRANLLLLRECDTLGPKIGGTINARVPRPFRAK